jgi:hypothetical protein
VLRRLRPAQILRTGNGQPADRLFSDGPCADEPPPMSVYLITCMSLKTKRLKISVLGIRPI